MTSILCCCPVQQQDEIKHRVIKDDDIVETEELVQNKSKQKSSSPYDIQIRPSTCIIKHNTNPEILYDVISQLGEGAFGRVVKVKHKKTGEVRAMKIVDAIEIGENLEELKNEINILKQLDHPNIVKVFEYFEYADKLFIVNELIPNGDLCNMLEEKKQFNESLSLALLKQLISAVKYLHSENIIHGDIKPENIMMDNYSYKSFLNKKTVVCDDLMGFDIKLIDFGSSKVLSPKKVENKIQGTAYYVAPEVILGGYHKQCDLWSCGVVLYVMLSGKFPFIGQNEEETFDLIKNQKPDFKLKEFKDISPSTLDLLKRLLEKDPLERITSSKALDHEAFHIIENLTSLKKNLIVGGNSSKEALKRLSSLKNNQKFQQAVTTFITHNFLSKEVATKHKEIFKALDANGDGRITTTELVQGYSKAGYNYTQEEIQNIINVIDKDNNGYIELEEFISASVDLDILLSETNIKLAFDTIDTDSSGKVSFNEIAKFIGGEDMDLDIIVKVVAEVGKNPEEEFSLEDFTKVMLTLKNCH